MNRREGSAASALLLAALESTRRIRPLGVPEVGAAPSRRWGAGRMVIPAPSEVDRIMRSVRKGRLITIDEIRRRLDARHGVDFACPFTTGVFAWIAAHAADEAEQAGVRRVTPSWRTLKSGGELNPKCPCGVRNLQVRLEAEGRPIVQRRKRFFVAGLAE